MDTPTAAQIEYARDYYRANAFGFNGPEDYAEAQFPRHSAAFQAAIAASL